MGSAPLLDHQGNFYRTAISSTLFLRTQLVRELGGFDETLGAGSSDGYLSGEESDLVLRGARSQDRLRYEPRLVVRQDEPRDDLPPDYAEKMAGYGRGFGRLFADHRLSTPLFVGLLGRKVIGAALQRAGATRTAPEQMPPSCRGGRRLPRTIRSRSRP